jgi:Sulfatase
MTLADSTGGTTGHHAFRDYLLCLSLANLHFINVWLELGNRGFDFFRGTRPAATALWAAVTLIVMLSLAFWVAVQLWRRLPPPVARPAAIVGIAMSLVVPATVIHRSVLDPLVDGFIRVVGRTTVYGIVAIIGGVLFAWLVARTSSAARAYSAALSLMLPLAPVLAVHATWVQWQRPPAEAYAGTVPSQSGRSTPTRLVVMVFDEWDQRLAIEERPDRVELPALDRILGQSFQASRAAGGGYLGVHSSIKSMLTGQRLQGVDPRSLGVQLEGDRRHVIDAAAAWVEAPTLFSEMNDRGWSSGVVGWYIPYCRLQGQHMGACSWQPGGSVYGRRELVFELSYPENLRTIAVRQLERVPMSRRLGLDRSPQERRLLLAEEFTRVRDRFSTAIDSAEFLYVHWPVPHPFGLEDPSSPIAGRVPNYLDNLAVVDRLLADVEDRLTRAGRWDQITLVVTSDHSLRSWYWEGSGAWTDEEQHATGGRQSPYVPFVVKFAGRHAPLLYDKPFTIALLYDVVLAIADEAVTTPAELAAWLDAHRGKHPTDVNAHRGARVAGS